MKPDAKQLIAALGAEYEKDEGFLGLLRTAHFDSHARDRLLRLLASIDVSSIVNSPRYSDHLFRAVE